MYSRLTICLVGLLSAGTATAADSLREDLRSGDRAKIIAAMDQVYKDRLDDLFPDVYEAFAASDDTYVRRKAAFTLIRRGAPQAVPLIRDAIDDPKAEFGFRHLGSREMAIQKVLLTKDDELIFDAIRTAIDDDDIYYRKCGTAVLAAHPPALRHFTDRLPKLARDPHPVIRFTFFGKLTASDQSAELVLPLVLEAVRSQDPTDCIAGAYALSRFRSWPLEHPEEAVGVLDHLIAKLDADDLEQAGAAGSALVMLRSRKGVIEATQGTLANGSPQARAFAATVLQDTATPFDVRQLTPAIADGDEATQLRAVALLSRQASLDAVPLLKRALESPCTSVRRSAVFALRAVAWIADHKEVGAKPNGNPVSTLVLRTERTPDEQAQFEAAQAALKAAELQPDLSRLARDALVKIGAVRVGPSELLIDHDEWKRQTKDRPERQQNDVAGGTIEPGPVLKIGSHKQLFVDDFIVDDVEKVQRIAHPFVKHADNPVFYAEAPWEENWVDNFMCSVLYDETTRAFKMWYRCGARHTLGAYAVSEDGITWHRPNLGRVEYDGSRDNNLLGWQTELYRDAHQPGHNVILQPDAEPSHRYLSFFDYSGEKRGFYVSYSPDGVSWSSPEHAQMVYGDVATLIPHPARGGFLLFAKQARWVDGYRRSFGFSHLKDVKGYAPKIYPFTARTSKEDALVGAEAAKSFGVLAAGTLDPSDGSYYSNWHTQIYSVTPLAYEGLVLGFYDLWYLTGKKEGPLELHFKASRDFENWFDVGYPQRMLPRGQMGQWDAGMVYGGSNILVIDDEIRLYYAGFNLGHYTGIPWGSRPDQVFGVGLATLRLDGFVSMSCEERGSVTTKPLAFKGTELRINARSPDGSVHVEIQDAGGDPLPGYTIADCDPFSGDALRQPVTWRGKSDVSAFAGRTVRLRFELHNADLFAFQFAE